MCKHLVGCVFVIHIAITLLACSGSDGDRNSGSSGGGGECQSSGELILNPHAPQLHPSITHTEGASFGVPVPDQLINIQCPMRLESLLEPGIALPASIKVHKHWYQDTGDSKYARWIRIDTAIALDAGAFPQLVLKYGPGVMLWTSPAPLGASTTDRMTIDVGERTFILDSAAPLGAYRMVVNNDEYHCGGDALLKRDVLSQSSAYLHVRFSGQYRSARTGEAIANCEIRFRFYKGSNTIRLFHTFTWLHENSPSETPPQLQGIYFDYHKIGLSNVSVGVDGNELIEMPGYVRQGGESVRDGNGLSLGTSLRRVHGVLNGETHTIAMRWWREHYPSDIYVQQDGVVSIGLIAGADRVRNSGGIDMSTAGLAVPDVSSLDAVGGIGGLAKTHELVIDVRDVSVIAPDFTPLVDEPLVYTGDANTTSKAHQPVQWVPRSNFNRDVLPTGANVVEDIEHAIDAAFDWLMVRDLDRTQEDVGWVYHGAHHYNFDTNSGNTNFRNSERYWMNFDGLLAGTPWIQWLRNGDRKLLDFAEANARYRMDVATHNGPGRGTLLETSPYIYGRVPWDNPNYGFAGFNAEVDFLIMYFNTLGYERACERLGKRGEIWESYPDEEDPTTRDAVNRAKELLALYRFFDGKRPILLSKAQYYLDVVKSDFLPVYGPTHRGQRLLGTKLDLIRQYHPPFESTVRELLVSQARFYGVHGTDFAPGDKNNLWGVQSIYPMLAVFEDPHSLDDKKDFWKMAVAASRDHALAVQLEDADFWRGMTTGDTHEFGADIREWMDILAYLEAYGQQDILDATYPARFTEIGPGLVHTMYLRCPDFSLPSGQPLFQLHFATWRRGEAKRTDNVFLRNVEGLTRKVKLAAVSLSTQGTAGMAHDIATATLTVKTNECPQNSVLHLEFVAGQGGVAENRLATFVESFDTSVGLQFVHVLDRSMSIASPVDAATYWVKATDTDFSLQLNQNRYLANGAKVLLVRDEDLIVMCRSEVILSPASRLPNQKPCEFTAEVGKLYAVTAPVRRDDLGNKGRTNFPGSSGLGPQILLSATADEYFELGNLRVPTPAVKSR